MVERAVSLLTTHCGLSLLDRVGESLYTSTVPVRMDTQSVISDLENMEID